MNKRALRPLALLVALVAAVSTGALATGAQAGAQDPLCANNYGGAAPRVGAPLRFGVDPGIAGSAGAGQLPSTPDNAAKDLRAVRALRPAGRVLVARLNRLFWSDGEAGIAHFRRLANDYTRAGIDVELQVRYHPGPGEAGKLWAWRSWVRHVVDVFGSNPRVVAMTITNEVNVTFSPNTSDGVFARAQDALIQGIEAARNEALHRRFGQLRFGFTYAYRFSPKDDASFFSYLGAHGGASFQAALGFVGLDFYPGSIYPPTSKAGTYRGDMAQALGTVRKCFMRLGAIPSRVPIWITENGIPTRTDTSDAQQARGLNELVRAARDYSRTFNVTDYRWFNLRDSRASRGAAPLFQTDGLLRADYSRKPAFTAFHHAIAALGLGETQPRRRDPPVSGRRASGSRDYR